MSDQASAANDGTTHADGCHTWGRQHYECALRVLAEREAQHAEKMARFLEAEAQWNKDARAHVDWHNAALAREQKLLDTLNQIIVRADQRTGAKVSDDVCAIARAALAEQQPA